MIDLIFELDVCIVVPATAIDLLIRPTRLWLSALALFGFGFSLKASLKDRLFSNADGTMKQAAAVAVISTTGRSPPPESRSPHP